MTEIDSGGCASEEVCEAFNFQAVSIDELEGAALDVVPTPASTELYINFFEATSGGAELLLRDYSGRIVRTYSIQNSTALDVSNISRGAYILQLNLEGTTPTYKHVILN